ncbi:MAG: hypothetical protein ACKO8I_17725 [Cyanobacteriota bacterium]
MLRGADGSLLCGHCGDPLERVPLVRPGPAIAGALVLVALVVAALPRRTAQFPGALPGGPVVAHPPLVQALAAAQGPPGLIGISEAALQQQLAEADRSWIPRAEPLPDGRIRYLYKRRAGEPELSIEELRAMIASPPSFERERQVIWQLLEVLRRVGVRIELSAPRKPGAAGEWDPAQRTIRIQPRVVAKGSREFARVLNHEAIHVAQSCGARGRLRSAPEPLGLGERLPGPLAAVLEEPIYRQASPAEQRLEREAYANQHRLELGAALVQQHCPAR